MEKITIYDHFNEFYSLGCELAEFIEKHKINLSKSEQIKFARDFFSISILRSYINYGILTEEAQEILKSSIKEVRFSLDNIIKNRIKHPELDINDYKLIPEIIANPTKIVEDKEDVLLFKNNNKYYKVVIKTTINKNDHTIEDLRRICEYLGPDENYYIQNFEQSDYVLDKSLKSFSKDELIRIEKKLKKEFPNVKVRGL